MVSPYSGIILLCELTPPFVRSYLSRAYQYFDRPELEEDDLEEALAKHAECWEEDDVDPSVVAPTCIESHNGTREYRG